MTGPNHPQMPPYPSIPPAPHPPHPAKKAPVWVWIVSAIGVVLVIGLIGSACSGGSSTTATPTLTHTTAPQPFTAPSAADTGYTPAAPPVTTAATPAAELTIPDDLIGKNGAIAEAELKKLGFKDIQHASGTPGVQMVIMLSNWTVTEVEPGPGTVVSADTPIVLTMVKKNR